MTLKQKYTFPEIAPCLEQGKNLDEIRSLYIEKLRSVEGDSRLACMIYANKLEEAKFTLGSKNLLKLERDFKDFKHHLTKWATKNDVSLVLKRRQKDFLGLNEKIRLYLELDRPIERIQDILGFRLILCTGPKDDANSIRLCYETLNETINFFVENKHYSINEAEPKVDTDNKVDSSLDIFIPKEDLLAEDFKQNVKDYIKYPKQNGYQSLHVIIRWPTGMTFEVQIRTEAMDLLAEHGSSNHSNYKGNKYLGVNLNVDLKKVNLRGFQVSENGTIIEDYIGLRKSIDPFNIIP